jgi:hypothetical protein
VGAIGNAVGDCGADNLGAADATAALQRCLDRFPAVFLPYGVYVVSGTLTVTGALVGEQLSNWWRCWAPRPVAPRAQRRARRLQTWAAQRPPLARRSPRRRRHPLHGARA